MLDDRRDERTRWGDPVDAPGAPGAQEQVFDEEPYLGTEADREDGDRMARADRLPGAPDAGGTPPDSDGSPIGGAVLGGGAGAIAGGVVAGPPGAVVGGVIGAVAGAAAGDAADRDGEVYPEDGGA